MLAALTLLAMAQSASAVQVDFVCSPDEGGIIVGLPPLEVRCVVELPTEGTWDRVLWSFGDGELVEADTAISHVFDTVGQHTVAVTLEGYEGPIDDGVDDAVDTGSGVELEPEEDSSSGLSERKYGYVTVCGAPDPHFSYLFKGGLEYQMVNTTQPQPNCLDEVMWTVHRGDNASGISILDPRDTWEPNFTMPEEGTYTFLLSMGGIAGTESAKLTVDAKFGLTEELDLVRARCATAPSSAAGGLGLVVLLLGLRRRR